MSLNKWFLGAAALLAACTPSVEQDSPSDVGPVALFAPSSTDACASVLPYPTDLARDPETGRLNIPFCPGEDATTTAIKRGLRTLDGYAVQTPIYALFSEPLDESSLTAPGAVILATIAGVPVPADAVFRANTDNDSPSDDNALYIVPRAPLAERSTYVVVVTNGVRGADGNPIVSDVVFQLLKSDEPLVDERGYSVSGAVPDDNANALEPVRQALQPLFQGLELGGIPRENIAVAWTFTTQTVRASYPMLAQLVSATTPAATPEGAIPASQHVLVQSALGDLAAALGCVYTGRLTVTNLLTDAGTFGVGDDGMPLTRATDVDYLFITSAAHGCGAALPAAAKVAVYAHGLGRCKNDALALAPTMLAPPTSGAGYDAILSLDGPRAGSRVASNLGDQDLDGCPDQRAIPELIALDGETPNPFELRDHMRQWGLELVQVANAVKADVGSFAAGAAAGTPTVAVIGHSFGGMAAILAGSVGSTSIDRLATNAASADFGDMFAPLLPASALSTYEWVLEPADPLFAAADVPEALAQVVSGGEGEVDEPAFHQAETQLGLVEALGNNPVPATFTMTTAEGESVCTEPSGIVGAVLVPCSDAPEALGQLVAMRTQLVTYILTGTIP